MVLPHLPLERPDGSQDWMNALRPLIGYGPESMYVAYNRFYRPDLAHYEARNASPDRSHNETFDSLVITGVLGFVVYMFLFASVFYYGFRWLGVIANAVQRNLFIGCWIGGGILGALAMVLWQGAEFFGVGLPAGIAGGLGVYLVIWGLFFSQRIDEETSASREHNPYSLLVVALVAAILAHFVEIHFGIAIAATRTYFWAYTGLLVVVGYLIPFRMRMEQEAEQQRAAEADRLEARRRRRRRRSRHVRQRETQDVLVSLRAVLPYALVLALILSVLAFDFVSNNQLGLATAQEVVVASVVRRPVRGELVPSYGIVGVVGVTWVLGSTIIVAEWLRRGGQGGWRVPLGACLSISVVIAFLFALVLAGRLVSIGRQVQLLDRARLVMGMLSTFYVLAFAVLLGLGAALLGEDQLPRLLWRPMRWWSYPILLVGMVLTVLNTNLKVVHADMVYKHAQPYERERMWDFSIILHQEAISLAPQEDFYHLFLGRAFLEKAKSAPVAGRPPRECRMSDVMQMTPQQLAELSREDLMDCSESALRKAREISPLNTDHSANLGRLYRARAESTSDSVDQYELFQKSLAHYAEATSLSPNAAHLYNEWGVVYLSMGERERALAKYEHSLSLDDEYEMTYMSLGDAFMRSNELDKAAESYRKAIEVKPNLPDVHGVLAYIYGMQQDYEAAISETLEVLDLTRNPSQQYISYKNLALYYQQLGRLEEAMRAAQEALARAPDSERPAVEALIAKMVQGGVAPETELMVQQFLSEGEVALNNGQWAVAEQAYGKALALNANLAVAHSALAYIYGRQGKLEEAEAENLAVLAAIPDDYATLKNLAIIYRELKRYDDSTKYARLALGSPYATAEDRSQLQLFIGEVERLRDSG
jgi:tetratricopeptide (TPR) repeat protein